MSPTSKDIKDAASIQRAESRRKKNYNPAACGTKTNLQKDRQDEKAEGYIYQMKEQEKTPEKQLNEVEIRNLPEKEFRIIIVKMIQDLGKTVEAKIEKMQEMFNKGLEELRTKKQRRKITEMKNTLEGINSRITEAEERISDLEDRMVEITATEQKKE